MTDLRYAVVIPTVGRASLSRLLDALARQQEPLPEEVIVVDDRGADAGGDLMPEPVQVGAVSPRVVRGWGCGPAAARNLGWQLSATPWVAFLDDDVVIADDWSRRLDLDLADLAVDVAGSQARLVVPQADTRRPTDWERATAGLESAAWATADMAYRRSALLAAGGFDERFRRAYREDADLALRLLRGGWRLSVGRRVTTHPVRPADPLVSVRVQRGNADDALMRRLHGRRWRREARTGRGRFPWHVATTVAAAVCVASAPFASASRTARLLTLAGAGSAAALYADFAVRRIRPGPRTSAEVAAMLWTSALIPPAAVWHRLGGWWRHRDAPPWPTPPRAVLLDRDGTLVHDVPYNGDPEAVDPMPAAGPALDRLRRHGIPLGVVSNQSGVARGLLTQGEVDSVNAAVEAELGPFATWQVCPHGPEDDCPCRKPRAGMILAGARDLGVRPEECVVIGDIAADVVAARVAGARSVLVPTAATRIEEVADAPVVAADLASAADLVLGWRDD
jgi:histidinol-phosphate phosphatase family protein